MTSTNDLFSKIANDILVNSPKASNFKAIGVSLYDDFIAFVLSNDNKLTPIKRKFITVFNKDKKDIFSIEVQSSAIKITLNAKYGMLKDTKNLCRDVSKVGHWGNGDYQIKIEGEEHFDYVMKLIKQIS